MNQSKLHPAWKMMIACSLLQFGSVGMIFNCSGIFLPPVCAELGVSTAQFSFQFSLRTFVTLLTMPLAARWLGKVPLRPLLSACALATGLGLGALSLCGSIWQWYAMMTLTGVSEAFLQLAVPMVITNWFEQKKGIALGVAYASSGVAGIIMNPVGSWLIAGFGWRSAYFVFGVLTLLFTFVPAFFVLRFAPGELGLRPYGAKEPDAAALAAASAAKKGDTAEPTHSIWDRKLVCLFAVCLCLSYPASHTQQFPQFVLSLGMTASMGATLSSMTMAGNLSGKLIFGWLADRLSVRATVNLAAGLVLGGTALLLWGGGHYPLLLLGGLCFGFCYTVSTVGLPLVVDQLYPREDYARVFSLCKMAFSVAGMFGPTIVGLIYDLTSSYHLAFLLCLIVYGLSSVLFNLLMHFAPKKRAAAQ